MILIFNIKRFVESATRAIAKFSKSSKIVVEKSTVPVPCRTAEHIQTILNSNKNKMLVLIK